MVPEKIDEFKVFLWIELNELQLYNKIMYNFCMCMEGIFWKDFRVKVKFWALQILWSNLYIDLYWNQDHGHFNVLDLLHIYWIMKYKFWVFEGNIFNRNVTRICLVIVFSIVRNLKFWLQHYFMLLNRDCTGMNCWEQ